MFSKDKDLEVQKRSLLAKKDVKALKEAMCKQYPTLQVEPYSSDFNVYIPDKAAITEIKLANRTLLYLLGRKIIFFDRQGRNHLFPSVYTLWRFPKLMRQFVIHAPVSHFVLKGADLMLPGLCTLQGLESLKAGERACIRVRGNPMPFAVGETCMSFEGILVNRRKGRGLETLHFFGDFLCLDFDNGVNNGSSSVVRMSQPLLDVPNKGFEIGQDISPIEAETFADDEVETPEVEPDLAKVGGKSGNDTCGAGYDNRYDNSDKDEIGLDAAVDIADANGELISESGAVRNLNDADPGSTANPDDDDVETDLSLDLGASAVTPDELAERAAMLCLRYIVKPDKLPILASNLWFLVQRCSIADAALGKGEGGADSGSGGVDIKKTSFKKVSNYFSFLEKRGLLVLQTSDDEVTSILSVDENHTAFRGHKIANPADFKAIVYGTGTGAAGGLDKGFTSSGKAQQATSMDVLQLTKLPKSINSVPFDHIPDERIYMGEKLLVSDAKNCIEKYVTDTCPKEEVKGPGDKKAVVRVGVDHPFYSFALKLLRQEANKSEEGKNRNNSSNSNSKNNGNNDSNSISNSKNNYGNSGSNSNNKKTTKSNAVAFISNRKGGSSSSKVLAEASVHAFGDNYEEEADDYEEEAEEEEIDDSYDPTARNPNPSLNPNVNLVGGVRMSSIDLGPSVWRMGKNDPNPSLSSSSSSLYSFEPKEQGPISNAWGPKPSSSSTSSSSPNSSSSSAVLKKADLPEPLLGDGCVLPKHVLLMGLYDLLPLSYALIDCDGGLKSLGNKFPKVTAAYFKRASKDVTVVKGLDVFFVDLKPLMKAMQKHYSCSVTITEVAAGSDEKALVLQGRVTDVLDWLVEQFKLPRRCVA